MTQKDKKVCAFCGWERAYSGVYYFKCSNCGRKNKIKSYPLEAERLLDEVFDVDC